jgi:TorA maturation chaperone TorD
VGFRYLERLQSNAVSPFYARLAVVTTRYLQDDAAATGAETCGEKVVF